MNYKNKTNIFRNADIGLIIIRPSA